MSDKTAIEALASACADCLPAQPTTFRDDRHALGADFDRLIAEVRASDPRFAFDREGRPGAIAAVRQALPAMEADLLDAVLDDFACELAAVEEALYRLALAARR
jgi:hypothetical protein